MKLSNARIFERTVMIMAKTRSLAGQLKTLKRSDLPPDTGVILCVVRDEIALLAHFLAHYRAIGVERFAFIDNGSVDETVAFLLDQPDCDVFQSMGNFREAGSGVIWKNILMAEYRAAPWFLSVDADEHAVYDEWLRLSLPDYANLMHHAGFGAVTGIMVEMYGAGPVLETAPRVGETLLQAAPLFDGDGYTIAMPDDWRADNFPRINISGGPAGRLFGTNAPGWLAKTPLILEPNALFGDPHTAYPVTHNLSAPRLALLHFKFVASIVTKIERVTERKLHAPENLRNYGTLGEILKADPAFSLAYPGSVQFDSPQRFIERGMIRATEPVGLR